MKKLACIGCWLVLLVSPISLSAQTVEESVDDVLAFTGIAEQVAAFPAAINQMFAQQQKSFDTDSYQVLTKIIAEQFGQEAFQTYIKDELVRTFDKKLYAKLKATYKKPLIINVTKAEVEYATARDMEKIKAFDYDALPAARKQVIENFMVVTEELAITEMITRSGIEAFITTFNLFLPDEKKIKPELVQQITTGALAQVRSEASILTLKKSHALCYAKFNDKQLAEYAQMYSTPEGKWMMKSYMTGFDTGFKSTMAKAADAIKASFNMQDANT